MMLFVSTAQARPIVFDVRKYGITADDATDISKALLDAFRDTVCISYSEQSFGSEREIHVEASDLTGSLLGGAVFDGQGPKAWGTCGKSTYCKNFQSNIVSKDSKQFHVNVLSCNNFTFSRFTISAPEHSLNTDGIHIARSTRVNVLDSKIATGDDCVSLGNGNNQITIKRVTCGPGHGISVGSLGKNQNEDPVVGVTIRNCTISQTSNGVRIKTWPASYPAILVSKVTIKNIRGTYASPVAVKLSHSSGVPCTDVEIADIDITYTGKEATNKAVSQCSNVHPDFQKDRTCQPAASPLYNLYLNPFRKASVMYPSQF
ncbi:hypothetical protein EZV62_020743 [Acer yangbiense]|uniref:Pectate lyase superfamily protein domain-containing protein n=1 Tax=Acer yangbiense TaxID=1000413 RepID=A0A5C7HEV0_9ROSI|nr:hypothetical protein EZV62_020743 [Acer yangbiense]